MAFIDTLLEEKRAEIHKEAIRLANIYFLRYGRIPAHLKHIAQETAPGNIARKFNPNHDELGRFTFGDGGSDRTTDSENNDGNQNSSAQPAKNLSTSQQGIDFNGVKVPITQPQFDALTSLTYNIGAGAFRGSTLLQLLNQGDYDGAAEQFSQWNHAHVDGTLQVDPGLTNRRNDERNLFLNGTY